jgi:hypothetical protein
MGIPQSDFLLLREKTSYSILRRALRAKEALRRSRLLRYKRLRVQSRSQALVQRS